MKYKPLTEEEAKLLVVSVREYGGGFEAYIARELTIEQSLGNLKEFASRLEGYERLEAKRSE